MTLWSKLSFDFAVLIPHSAFRIPHSADVADLQPVRDLLVRHAQRVGHADGKFGAPAQRREDLFELHVGGLEHLHHSLGDLVRVEPAVELRVLRGDAARALAQVADVAAVVLVAETACGRLHDVLADVDCRCAEHDQRSRVCCEVAALAHAARGNERELVLLALLYEIEVAVADVRCDGMAHLVHGHVVRRARAAVLAVDAKRRGIRDCARGY